MQKPHRSKDMGTRIAQLTNSNEILAGRRVAQAALQWERRHARAELLRLVGAGLCKRGLDIRLPLRVVAMLPSVHLTGAHIGGLDEEENYARLRATVIFRHGRARSCVGSAFFTEQISLKAFPIGEFERLCVNL